MYHLELISECTSRAVALRPRVLDSLAATESGLALLPTLSGASAREELSAGTYNPGPIEVGGGHIICA